MRLIQFRDADQRDSVYINPEHVVALTLYSHDITSIHMNNDRKVEVVTPIHDVYTRLTEGDPA